jgi:HAD superfamily hydrolase (TIGR01484 family)
MRHPKLVVFDLDGTLAESKQPMTAPMGDALSRLLQKVPVAVMSGGGWRQFEHQFFPALPLGTPEDRLYIFPTNAAACFVHREGQWHPQYDLSFSPDMKEKIMEALDEAMTETRFEQPAQIWGEQVEDRGGEITFSALGQEAPLREKETWDPDGKKRKPLYEALHRKLPDLAIGLNATTSIDITPHGIDKAYGVKRLSELTGIAPEEMLYVGDALEEGGNDSVVIATGIPTHEVFGPQETAALIETLLQ